MNERIWVPGNVFTNSLIPSFTHCLVQRVEQELENHDKNHGRQKAHDCFNQNINDINKGESLHGVIEKDMGKHQDGHVLHKPAEAHTGDGWAVRHVVSAPGFQYFEHQRPHKAIQRLLMLHIEPEELVMSFVFSRGHS